MYSEDNLVFFFNFSRQELVAAKMTRICPSFLSPRMCQLFNCFLAIQLHVLFPPLVLYNKVAHFSDHDVAFFWIM